MSDARPHDKNTARKVAVSASVALALMVLDFCWLIRDEIKYIWPRLRMSWSARIFLLTRYVGIASQIYNVYFTMRMYRGVQTSPSGCRLWFGFQAAVVQFLLFFAEALLMRRLYLLFLRNRPILMMLVSFGLCQTISMGVSARLSLPSNKHTVTCLVVKSNPGNAFFSATTMTTNVIIFFMTSWRFLRLPDSWTRERLGQVLMRDSAISLSAITLMMLFLTLCSFRVITTTMSGNITYYWFVFVLWVSIGRIVVDHLKIQGDDESDTWRGTVQLTSMIETGASTLLLDTQCGTTMTTDGQTCSSRTLHSPTSMLTIKTSELGSSTACASDTSSKWLGDYPPSFVDARQRSLSSSSSSMGFSAESSLRRLWLSPNRCRTDSTSASDVPQQTEDCPTDADEDECRPNSSPSPSPRPSSTEPPPSSDVPVPP